MNFLDELKKYEEEMRPCAMACLLSNVVEKEGVTIELDTRQLGDLVKGKLRYTTKEWCGSCYLAPTEVTLEKIKGNYKTYFCGKDNNAIKTILHSLKKIGMSFQEKDRSVEGTVSGKFTLKVE